jgi:hypothetical protein
MIKEALELSKIAGRTKINGTEEMILSDLRLLKGDKKYRYICIGPDIPRNLFLRTISEEGHTKKGVSNNKKNISQ